MARSSEQTMRDGAYANQRLNLVAHGKAHQRKAKTSNRTSEIRPSGMIGGPRKTWPGRNCEPISQPKGRDWKPSTYSAVSEFYPDHRSWNGNGKSAFGKLRGLTL